MERDELGERANSDVREYLNDTAWRFPVMLAVMNAEDAFARCPFVLLSVEELSQSVAAEVVQIVDLAHGVPGTVATIEVLQRRTRKFGAVRTEVACAQVAGPHDAAQARLTGVLFQSTAATRIAFSQEGFADSAIHSTWGDE